MNKDEYYWVAMAMKKWGGSFVKTLGDLILHADSENLILIRTTWSQYWEEYRMMGELNRSDLD